MKGRKPLAHRLGAADRRYLREIVADGQLMQRVGGGERVKTSKKERERLREAMSRSLAVSPKRQREIAEMIKGQPGA